MKYLLLLAVALVVLAISAPPLLGTTRARAALPDWENVSPAPVGQFGFQTIISTAPGVVYVGTDSGGLLKSTNSGLTWTRVDLPWGSYCAQFDGRLWTLAVDRFTNALYTVNGYGCAAGVFKSVDGGVHWASMLGSSGINPDIYHIEADPYLANHILVSLHSGSGVGESFDGGVTWLSHPGQSGSYVMVLNNSSTWLLATQDSGMWKTTNNGQSWAQVSTYNMMHGADQLYHAPDNSWYVGSLDGVLRSTNNGDSWTLVWPDGTPDGVNSVFGANGRLYTRSANTGQATTGPLPFKTSTDGVTWSNYSAQTFTDGPMSMASDGQYIYASLWGAGVWRLPIGSGPTATSTPPISTATAIPTATSTPVMTATPTSTPVATSASSTATPTATATTTPTTQSCLIPIPGGNLVGSLQPYGSGRICVGPP